MQRRLKNFKLNCANRVLLTLNSVEIITYKATPFKILLFKNWLKLCVCNKNTIENITKNLKRYIQHTKFPLGKV